MDSAITVTTTAQMLLFRALHRHFSGAPHRTLLRHNLKRTVTSYNNRSRIPCSSTYCTSRPLSPSLRNFRALLSRTPCRTSCVSSSAASFGSTAGGGNGGAGVGNGGGGGGSGSGGESGDGSVKLVGDAAQEVSALSPDVIILDVSV